MSQTSAGRELTQSTIAVVVDEPTTPFSRIADAELRPLLRPPIAIGQMASGETIISSNRDQLEVIFSPTKINVRDLSGDDNFTGSKIPTVVHRFFGLYNTSLKTYGVNFVVEVEMPNPDIWIRDHLLASDLSERTEKELLRGSANISLRADPKIWNIQFRRNPEEKLEINFNASQESAKLPGIPTLTDELQQQYQELDSLMTKLGL